MNCKNCGTYNNEDRETCRTCGFKLDNSEAEETIKKESNTTKKRNSVLGIGILSVLLILVITSMLIPTTVDASLKQMEKYEEPYTVQEAYTVDVPYTVQEAYTVNVPYTVKYQEPVYKTVHHNDPIYKTLSTYNVDYKVAKNVYDIKKEYTGTNFWGTNEYKVTVWYYNNLEKDIEIHYEVHGYTFVENYEVIVDYKIWSEKVIDKYITKERTEYKDETKYRDVIKYKSETRYRDVTKTKTLEREITVIKTINCTMYEKVMLIIQHDNINL